LTEPALPAIRLMNSQKVEKRLIEDGFVQSSLRHGAHILRNATYFEVRRSDGRKSTIEPPALLYETVGKGCSCRVDVILAGVNVDWDALTELRARSDLPDEELTPETISAAYARISRNPLSVDTLRRLSRGEVEKARRSNTTIVFDMGHSSIAEHAVFNIDILGASRLAVEFIEAFRLASYTEKSQRYIRLDDDFVIAEEIRRAGLSDIFTDTIRAQNALYRDLYEAIRHHLFSCENGLEENPERRSLLEGSAKEDARYILALATESQLGMTVNARTLELMLRRAAAHRLAEVREYGRKLYSATRPVAPSLIRYTEATDFDRYTARALREEADRIMGTEGIDERSARRSDSVALVKATDEGDELILASLLSQASGRSLEECLNRTRRLPLEEKKALVIAACGCMEAYDAPPRSFEMADLTFEIIMSASCFAQMKRHRMATIINGDYDPSLGVTLPETIREAGMEEPFKEMIDRTNHVYDRILAALPDAAPYILTNAHRKRVLVKVNIRELYHMARLREDRHSQWDIRNRVAAMVALARQVMPLSLMFACGKDAFQDVKRRCVAPS